MMKRASACLAMMLTLASAAQATETMSYSAEGDAASIDVLLGAMDVIAFVNATVTVGDQVWSTDRSGNGEIKITLGQAFENDEQMLIDLTDENVNAIVARLRLFKAAEQSDFALGGTLTVAGVGAWAVTCPAF